MQRKRAYIAAYFFSWLALTILAAGLNALNINWAKSNHFLGFMVVIVLTLLQSTALEFFLMTVVSIFFCGFGGRRKRPYIIKDFNHNLSCIINYNLLAKSEDDIDDAYSNMYQSFMSNLYPRLSAVLLSATGFEELRIYEIEMRDNYRALIKRTLMEEGQHFILRRMHHIDEFRLRYFWKHYLDWTINDLKDNLVTIVDKVAKEFMCIHRVSRVLRKCGQYQDLMLLSEGEKLAYTYTDPNLYGVMARGMDEAMFCESECVANIHNRKYDYTLVMDSDTICPPGTAIELLAIAATHPDKGIIQPAIKLDAQVSGTVYMFLEMWREKLSEPMARSMALMLGQWGFYGKGMINNKIYISEIIGTRENLIEIVPIDVLSHDTYEAAVLRPFYVDSLYFEEEPSYNYVTWHIRERRWNQGEIILSKYFWPNTLGKLFAGLTKVFDRKNYIKTKVRTDCRFNMISVYVAHSALRSMLMKPLMLVYVFLHIGIELHRPYIPLGGVIFMVCIMPKIAIVNCKSFKYAMIEIFASILQYTPEAFVGSIRLCKAVFATVCKSFTENWTPQRVIEAEIRSSNPFRTSFKHLWFYSLSSFISIVIVAISAPGASLIHLLLCTLFLLPFFTAFTTLTPKGNISKTLPASKYGANMDNNLRPSEALMEEGRATPVINENVGITLGEIQIDMEQEESFLPVVEDFVITLPEIQIFTEQEESYLPRVEV